ncbi:MAG TPA: 50S ribosomal protein L18 [Cyclobacteriaceae bacterium]
MAFSKYLRRKKIKLGIRRKLSGTAARPRLSVYKSNKSIYAQIINDDLGSTLLSTSSPEIGESKTNNIEVSEKVGRTLAEKAIASGITNVVFDRNGYIFHGKVKALADGARSGGLKF